MLSRTQIRNLTKLLVFTLVFALLAPTISMARTVVQDDKKQDKKKDEAPKPSKEEREYQKIKRFSQDLYVKDAEFRQDVETYYLELQRQHMNRAYLINTRDSADKIIMRNGDQVTVDDTLYDNPLAQDYVNRVGQSIVPKNSTHLYAFKIVLNPVPEATSLSTGTIYVSTGMLALVDNEAQLAYALGHEIGHIEKEHWKEDALVAQGMQEYNQKQQKKRAIWGMVATVAAGAVGGAVGGANSAFDFANIAASLTPSLLKLMVKDSTVKWDRLQEDDADQLGMQYMLDRSYDVREVPKFYANLRAQSNLDPRARLGFIADKDRVNEREDQVKSLIGSSNAVIMSKTLYTGTSDLSSISTGKNLDPTRDAAGREVKAEKAIGGALNADVQAKLDAGELIGSTAEFEAVMAAIMRDNGVRAFYFDMFRVARQNLEESLRIRSNDPSAHFYYGKVLKLTARTPAEKSQAFGEFAKAIELDRRKVLPESHLYRALSMMETKDPAQVRDIIASLKEYVAIFQREHGGQLPPNMEVIYDYMQEVGENNWTATPALNVATVNRPSGTVSETVSPPPATTPAAVKPTSSKRPN